MRRFPTILILAALALGLGLPPLASAGDNDIDKVNGSVQVAAGQQVGDVSTVNGAVHVGDGASVHDLILAALALGLGLPPLASAGDNDIDKVNGSVQVAAGQQVGDVSTVNGAIVLDSAHGAGGIGTVGGDITVGADSHVEGGILVDKPNNGWFHWGSDRKPVIVIGPHAVVQGTLEFRRDVVLKVSDSAQIGPVKGATVERFHGDAP